MRLALLSDLHANLHALQACLAHARSQHATQLAFLGDLVGYGAQPAEVVDLVRQELARGAVAVKGNHDAFAVAGAAGRTVGEAGAAWTHGRLSAAQRDFLDRLPFTATAASALLVHASPDDPPAWHYVDNTARAERSLAALDAHPGVQHVFCGHVHEQRLFYAGRHGSPMPFEPTPAAPIPLPRHRRWLATVGSVGQPRDGDPRAMYALWDDQALRVTFHRVPYEHRLAAQAIRDAGLPEAFAARLEVGR